MVEGGVSMQNERKVTFEKGKVSEYNGQQDLYCNFVDVSEGETKNVYYLLNDKKLDNGLYIASTELKEAIDPQILRTHLGVINQKGDIIIPFTNKSIKIIEDKYLLVVRSEAKTKSVLDAIASRNDPTAAEKMVNANASIKDKLNKVMSGQGIEGSGKFILNDLLSEGTVYSLDGKNIFDNQYYSFIGMTNDSFYCNTNVPEASVASFPRTDLFSIKPNGVVEEQQEVIPSSSQPVLANINAKEEQESIDVSNVSVQKEQIDQALNSTSSSIFEEIKTPPVIDDNQEKMEGVSSDGESTIEPEPYDILPISIDKPEESEVVDNGVLGDESLVPTSDSKEIDKDNDISPELTDSNEHTERENVADIVGAVSDVVQRNKQLEKENADLLVKIAELEKSKEIYQEQVKNASQLEEENARLAAENEKLMNTNVNLEYTMSQIRQELGMPTTTPIQSSGYSYRMSA